MPRDTRNIGASVRARLLQRSRADNTDYQILLTRYALERLLYRLSLSAHRDRFVLKGALLFVTWIADPFRPTRDLDLLGYGDSSPEALARTFRDMHPLVSDLREFLMPVMGTSLSNAHWKPGGPWIPATNWRRYR